MFDQFDTAAPDEAVKLALRRIEEANARDEGINPALDQMMWAVVKTVPAWRA